MIALAAVARTQADRLRHLTVRPDQQPFCGSIDSHLDADQPSCDWHAVQRDNRVVGFFKIDRDYGVTMPMAAPGHLGLRGMMIDRDEQGRGTGRGAMALLRDHLHREYPDAPGCILTVNTINPAARAVYLAGGFCDTGQLYLGGRLGPQHILALDLAPKSQPSPGGDLS